MEINKKYYSIQEVSELIGKPASTIRFWETQMLWLVPKKRSRTNARLFQVGEIDQLGNVCYLMGMGMNFDGINRAYKQGYFERLHKVFVEINYKFTKKVKV